MEPWRLTLESWKLIPEFRGSPWSLRLFGSRLIQEVQRHGAMELVIDNGGFLIDHGG
jgi:hypothetical protein